MERVVQSTINSAMILKGRSSMQCQHKLRFLCLLYSNMTSSGIVYSWISIESAFKQPVSGKYPACRLQCISCVTAWHKMSRRGNELYFIALVAILDKSTNVVYLKYYLILFTLQTKLLYLVAAKGGNFIHFLQCYFYLYSKYK